jgi:hypothetical protein
MTEIQQLWQWFTGNHSRFAYAQHDRLLLDMILAKLREINNGFFFEMSLDLYPKEFIVTAAGNTKLFSLADEVIAHAPKLLDWHFISLKPPKGFKFTSRFRGFLFDPRKMWFMPLRKHDDKTFLGILVGYEGGSDFAEKEIVRGGTFLVLDTGLGERIAASNMQYLEIVDLPTNPPASGYRKVAELAEYISNLNAAGQPRRD